MWDPEVFTYEGMQNSSQRRTATCTSLPRRVSTGGGDISMCGAT